MTKRWFVIFSILTGLIVLSISWYGYLYMKKQNQWWGGYDYTVFVKTTPPSDFFVYVPVPVTVDGKVVPDLVNNIRPAYGYLTTGIGTFSLVETTYGVAMNLSGNGTISIRAKKYVPVSSEPQIEGGRHPNGKVDFNLWVDNFTGDTLGDVWVYLYTPTNSTVWIWLDLVIDNLHHSTKGNDTLGNGWNKLKVGGAANVQR